MCSSSKDTTWQYRQTEYSAFMVYAQINPHRTTLMSVLSIICRAQSKIEMWGSLFKKQEISTIKGT